MVVVMLIAILAVIATPAMITARADRIAFDFARRASELFHNGRARAAGRGAAHLVVFTNVDGGGRGRVAVFEGLDGATLPNPSSSCRGNSQWTYVETYLPGDAADADKRARVVDQFTVDTSESTSSIVTDDITMKGFGYIKNSALAIDGTKTAAAAVVVCTTPNGTTFAGTGATVKDAIDMMIASSAPFTGAVELMVERHRGGAVVGVTRRVVIAGAAAPRIWSQ